MTIIMGGGLYRHRLSTKPVIDNTVSVSMNLISWGSDLETDNTVLYHVTIAAP